MKRWKADIHGRLIHDEDGRLVCWTNSEDSALIEQAPAMLDVLRWFAEDNGIADVAGRVDCADPECRECAVIRILRRIDGK